MSSTALCERVKRLDWLYLEYDRAFRQWDRAAGKHKEFLRRRMVARWRAYKRAVNEPTPEGVTPCPT